MINLNAKLKIMHENGKYIRTAIVGAGQMGKGLVSQLAYLKGFKPSLLINRHIEKAIEAFSIAGVNKENLIITNNAAKANDEIRKGKYVLCEDIDIIKDVCEIDVVVDATGNTDAGALIAMNAITTGKHVVMLNVETDVTIGCILKREAEKNNVVYTASSGDEPGAVKELYDFADAVGLEVLVMGKGKNNKVDMECNPDTVRDEAVRRGMSPRMLASFKDGTKTMVELTCMSNATGFMADKRGAHGPKAELADLCSVLSLKENGGILNSYKTVEYVDGIAPGVFVIVTTDLKQIHHEIQYLKVGKGPNYCLFRPFHLCSIETPISIARAYIYKEASIVAANYTPYSDTVAVAKKDLAAGTVLDGIGGHCIYGTIESHANAKREKMVPVGLINNSTKLKKAFAKGEVLTYDACEFDVQSPVFKMRMLQDKLDI